MMGAKHRKSPNEARKLAESYLAVMNSLSDETAELHWGDAWKPEAGAE
jgi:hypothetical protein